MGKISNNLLDYSSFSFLVNQHLFNSSIFNIPNYAGICCYCQKNKLLLALIQSSICQGRTWYFYKLGHSFSFKKATLNFFSWSISLAFTKWKSWWYDWYHKYSHVYLVVFITDILLPLSTAEITLLENNIIIYKFIQDLHFFVTGGDDENEVILASVLQGFFDAVTLLLRYFWS